MEPAHVHHRLAAWLCRNRAGHILLLLLLGVQYLLVIKLVLLPKQPLLCFQVLNNRLAFFDGVHLLLLFKFFLLLLYLVLLDLHLQSLMVSLISLLIDLLHLIQVCLRSLLPLVLLHLLELLFLLLAHLRWNVNIIHVPLEDVILLVFSATLNLLVALLIYVKWVPVESSHDIFLVFHLGTRSLHSLKVRFGLQGLHRLWRVFGVVDVGAGLVAAHIVVAGVRLVN